MNRLLLIGLLLPLTISPAFADEEKTETEQSKAARDNKTSVESDPDGTGRDNAGVEWESKNGKADRRIKTLVYDPDTIYVMRARYGYQSHIEFSPSEEIQTISVGDRSLWQIVPAGHRLFVRPMDENMVTNMTIITNRRSYQFDLKAGPADDKSSDIIYVARFVYPGQRGAYGAPAAYTPPAYVTGPAAAPPPVAPPPAAYAPPPPPPSAPPAAAYAPPPPPPAAYVPPVEAPVAAAASATNLDPSMPTPLTSAGNSAPAASPAPSGINISEPAPLSPEPVGASPTRPNFNYTYSGADTVAPIQVYDDGASTYLKYRDMTEKNLPDVYFVSKSGQEKLVASHLQGEHVVIEGVADELVVRSPYGKAFVYNEASGSKAP